MKCYFQNKVSALLAALFCTFFLMQVGLDIVMTMDLVNKNKISAEYEQPSSDDDDNSEEDQEKEATKDGKELNVLIYFSAMKEQYISLHQKQWRLISLSSGFFKKISPPPEFLS